jgi:hypothetical protein
MALTLAAIAACFASFHPEGRVAEPGTLAAATTASPYPATASVPAVAAGRIHVKLADSEGIATLTLADTPAARELAAMLPVRLNLHDRFGQAKSGTRPGLLEVAAAPRTFAPVPGDVYYWPDGGQLAAFYDDLGQSVPAPGLVRLGSVEAGLNLLASRGDVTVTLVPPD